MVRYAEDRLVVTREVKDLVLKQCKEEFIRYNPKFKGMFLSQNFIVHRIAEHYMECKGL